MGRLVLYHLGLHLKSFIFWIVSLMSVLVIFMTGYTDISLSSSGVNLLNNLFVSITVSASFSLLMILNSFPSIQTYIHDLESGHHLFLRHRLGRSRYFLQIYLRNCLSSFCLGILMVAIFSLGLSLKYSLFSKEYLNAVTELAGGHFLLDDHPLWTLIYFMWNLGLGFAFYQLIASFLTILFPHKTMAYLYACVVWLLCYYSPIFWTMPFYLSPTFVFATDNVFYHLVNEYQVPLSLWYPFAYFMISFVLMMGLTLLVDKLRQTRS